MKYNGFNEAAFSVNTDHLSEEIELVEWRNEMKSNGNEKLFQGTKNCFSERKFVPVYCRFFRVVHGYGWVN